jgi:hypothetical protein
MEIDFQDYYQREQQLQAELENSNVKFIKSLCDFLCQERCIFHLDVPRDFALAQWGI